MLPFPFQDPTVAELFRDEKAANEKAANKIHIRSARPPIRAPDREHRKTVGQQVRERRGAVVGRGGQLGGERTSGG